MSTNLHDQLGVSSAVPSFSEIMQYVRFILAPDRSFYVLAIIYSIVISLLTLAVPVAVQALITSVANTGLPQAVFVLAIILFAVLSLSSILMLLRHYLLDRLERRMYARLSSWISKEIIYTSHRRLSDQNETFLINRYFDIMTLQTHMPELLMGGVTLVLQTIVGTLLVSFYHPLLMVFSATLIFLIYLVWRIWGPAAVRSSVALSHAKYNNAAWLHNMSAQLRKSDQAPNHEDLTIKSDQMIDKYLKTHIRHFHHNFSQVIAFAIIYAVANAALLGLGGYLVILGELTLGQLVAAELIMSVILVSMLQFGQYFSKFYDVCAASDELTLFHYYNIVHEQADADIPTVPVNQKPN
jgi:putative ABC transport system ATP-binding protein